MGNQSTDAAERLLPFQRRGPDFNGRDAASEAASRMAASIKSSYYDTSKLAAAKTIQPYYHVNPSAVRLRTRLP
nr:hypothetical protein [Armatimonadota bacterium]